MKYRLKGKDPIKIDLVLFSLSGNKTRKKENKNLKNTNLNKGYPIEISIGCHRKA